MEKIGQSFRLGIWTVKPEKRVEFVEAWQTSSDWLSNRLPNERNERGAVLLEDTNDPGRFISFAPVSDNEVVSELMSDADFQVLWARVLEFCNDVKPNIMRVAGSVTRQDADV